MRKKLSLLIITILFLPLLAKADTWLDKEEYRDTSWFNENTYSTTTEYTINSEKKLAGLLYLVNVKGFTFEDKIINIIGFHTDYDRTRSCDTYSTLFCYLKAHEHNWVPIDSSFLGIFNFNKKHSNNKISYNTINLRAENDVETPFLESNICKEINTSNEIVTSDKNCNNRIQYINYYSIKVIENNNVTMEVPEYGYNILEFKAIPKDGYYIKDIKITTDHKEIFTQKGVSFTYSIIMPKEKVTIEVITEKKSTNKCKIVTGTSKDLGDEIACGAEHFYVISNDGKNIRMMTKYNLKAGVIIYKVPLENNKTCAQIADEHGGFEKNDGFYTAPGYCFYYKTLPNFAITQSEDAKSAHWDENLNYLYPQVGDIYMYINNAYGDNPLITIDPNPLDNSNFYNFNINWNNEAYHNKKTFVNTMKEYKETFYDTTGVNVQDINMLSLTELNDIIEQITSEKIPLKEWGENVSVGNMGQAIPEIHFGDLKTHIPEKYSWLYSTTYWNRSIWSQSFNASQTSNRGYFVFTAEQGKLCGAGFDYCAPETVLGCGIRPVITISALDIIEESEEETTTDNDTPTETNDDNTTTETKEEEEEISGKVDDKETPPRQNEDKPNPITNEEPKQENNPNTNGFVPLGVFIASIIMGIILHFIGKKMDAKNLQ